MIKRFVAPIKLSNFPKSIVRSCTFLPTMKFVLLLVAVVIECTFAFKTCDPPQSSYGTYINHPAAFECPPGKRGPNNSGIKAQCISVVRKFCSGSPATTSWRRGTKVTNGNTCNSIPKYTPIASFTGSGNTYNGDNGHAGIFISCSGGNIVIADQWCAKEAKFNERTMSKTCGTKPASNCADYFYTIEW